MTEHTQKTIRSSEQGVALIYMAITLTTLLLGTGLAVDSGRAYVVKAQLTKAVDGAALGAARHLNGGDPRGEAVQIFKANFPAGYMGTSTATDPTAAGDFFTLTTDEASGLNRITVRASTILPTTFMKLGDFDSVTVGSTGEATRRMVDLCLALDVSGSIGWRWPYVRDASRAFVDAFDAAHDRFALAMYSNGANVVDAMPAPRGFNKVKVKADIPNGLPGGSTNMVEGLYRCWDEVKSVPAGTQSPLRIIVLFTDGASNSVPGNHDGTGVSKGLRTADFPKNFPDPDGMTWASPSIAGLYDSQSGNPTPGYPGYTPPGGWNSLQSYPSVPWLSLQSLHTHHRSAGIPTSFPLQTAALTVNGMAQSARRPLRNVNPGTGRAPSQVWNINNASRNLVEIIANAARSDNGDYRIRIYSLGMGELVRYLLGTMPEMSEDILKRVSNDRRSPDFNNAQLEGKYFFAETPDDVAPAFAGIQNEIIRLTK